MFQALKDNPCQLILLYPLKFFVITEGERKTFHDQKQAKEFMTTQMAPEKTLERILQTEEKGTYTHEAIEKDKPCWGSSEANEEQENIKKPTKKKQNQKLMYICQQYS